MTIVTHSWWLDTDRFYELARQELLRMQTQPGAAWVNQLQASGVHAVINRDMRGMPKHGGLRAGYQTDGQRIQ